MTLKRLRQADSAKLAAKMDVKGRCANQASGANACSHCRKPGKACLFSVACVAASVISLYRTGKMISEAQQQASPDHAQ
jgi:hypothetical protein